MSHASVLPQLVLASQSPRRKQLLKALGLSYVAEDPDADEEHPLTEGVEEIICRNALNKAASIATRLANPKNIIIGADTLVVLGSESIGKPKAPEDVKATLKKLSGVTHEVYTGLALLSPHYGCRQSVVRTSVTFRVLSSQEIENYAKTREPYDKAGSYAVQGLGMLFIEKIEGSYTNVMGLPLEKLLEEMEALTEIPIYQWFMP